jgi:hypothetical protein
MEWMEEEGRMRLITCKGKFRSKLGSHGIERWKHKVVRSKVRTDIGRGTA